jgi:hypothetical protein
VEQFRVERGIAEELVAADAKVAATQRELQDTRAQLQEAYRVSRLMGLKDKDTTSLLLNNDAKY